MSEPIPVSDVIEGETPQEPSPEGSTSGVANLLSLPNELIHMISENMPIVDMARFSQTCKDMRGSLTPWLYDRKVRTGDYYFAIINCAMTNNTAAMTMFLEAGAKLATPRACASADGIWRTSGENAGVIAAHPLPVAASLGHVETVQLLLDWGDKVNNKLGYGYQRTEFWALAHAIEHRHMEIIQLLIDAGCTLAGSPSGGNRVESIPLVRAARLRNLEAVRMIFHALKNNKKKYRIQSYRSQCQHAFRAAIKSDSYHIVKFFLGENFNPNDSRTDESFLYTAVTTKPPSDNKTSIVQLLLGFGADTVSRDPGLIQGCWAQAFDAVKLVLVAGCQWKYRRREVNWAKILAANAGRQDIVQLFDDYMNRRVADGEEIIY